MSGKVEGKACDALCRLIAAWVNGAPPEVTEAPDYEALFLTADRHRLTAVACVALEHAGLMSQCPSQTARRFQEKKIQSIRKTVLMDAERKAVLDFLEESGIWYLPLKGVVLNSVYPLYGIRQFADNDILFDAARWREVRDFMKRRGYKPREMGIGAHDVYLKPPIYNFEMHRQLFTDEKEPFLAAASGYYGDVKRRLVRDEGKRFGYHFRDEDFYVYYLTHNYKHWDRGGTGLRTVLDVYLYRRARPDMDGAYIAQELRKLGLADFESRFRTLGEKLFGPAPVPPLTRDEREMKDRLESSGAYGTLESHVRDELRRLQGDRGPAGGRVRVKYLLRHLFPNREWYRINAPFAYRHGWVRPFYWVFRLGRGVFANGGRNLRVLREVCVPPEGKSIFRLGAEKAKRLAFRPFQKPISKWPLEKQVARAMRDYERQEGHTFDLERPTLFTEKRVWYGLFFEHPDLTRLYDKYLFKGYIEEKLGPGWTAPLYGMWTDLRDFRRDWDHLPDAFCLKSNCSSEGCNLELIRDKNRVDKKALFRKVKKWLDPMNTGVNSTLKAYAGITPRVIAEELLTDDGRQLMDYKVLCFDGEPTYVYCVSERFSRDASIAAAFYDLEWNKLPLARRGRRNLDFAQPPHFKQMLELSKRLSEGFPQIRVDFYEADGALYIGEMTLYSAFLFDSEEWDRKFGEKFILPSEGGYDD